MTQQGRPSADSLRAVLHAVFSEPAYRWSQRPDPFATVIGWLNALGRWLTAFHDANPRLFETLFWVLLVVGLAIAAHTGLVAARAFRAGPRGDAAILPVASRRDPAWYRAEADRLAAEGRFVDAMQADFLALVLTLDARTVLRFHPSKTPGDYTREGSLAGASQASFRELVRRLYGYAFGRIPCGPTEFAEWRALALAERYAAPD